MEAHAPDVSQCSAERRAQILRIGKAQLDRLEAMRKAFTKSRALSLAQRELLYAKDELEMCTMRMRVCLSLFGKHHLPILAAL